MKKILSVLAVMAVACSAFAQGQISFSSPASSVKVKATPTSDPVNIAANGGFVSALWAPAGTAFTAFPTDGSKNLAQWLASNPGWLQVESAPGTPLAKATAAGRVLATSITVGTLNPVDLIMIGWAGTATTFDAAFAAAAPVGFSDKVTVTPTAVPSPPATVAFSGGLTLTPTAIPEPSTFALAGLGAAALMIFRRRK